MPKISLVSPWTNAAHVMSPLTLPSRCRSAVASRSPSTVMSEPKIVSVDFRFFENIALHLQEGRIHLTEAWSENPMQVLRTPHVPHLSYPGLSTQKLKAATVKDRSLPSDDETRRTVPNRGRS